MNLSQSINPNDNYKLIYSPRTTYSTKKSLEKKLYKDLLQSFDPYTLKILRRHFKEHLGSITKDLFVCILKRHLLSWNPKIKNRPKILIQLLSQLFEEIDLDSDDIINWNEFSNFLVYIGNSKKIENSSYFLRKYFKCKSIFDHTEKPEIDDDRINYLNASNNEIISYCFYIAKYRFLGIIHEGKNKIIFFNAETQKRLKLEIDFTWVQEQIDKYEIYEYENKTEELLKKQEQKKLLNKAKLEEKYKQLFEKYKKKLESRNKKNDSFSNEKKDKLKEVSEEKNNLNKSINNERVSTPKTIKKERNSKSINLKKNLPKFSSEIKKNKNYFDLHNKMEKKQYHIVCTLFLDNYNLLFISSTNNIISAWKFKEKEEYFENANLIIQNIENPHNKKECVFEKNNILLPLFYTEYTQYTMCFDYMTNNLYTGQTDGKILKWEMTVSKPILILDINEFNKNNLLLPKIALASNLYDNEVKEIKLKIGQSDLNKILKLFPENKRNTVSCLIYIDPLKILCSAHYNGQIIIWDIVYNRPKRRYTDQKTGIYQLLYDPKKNHIYSCGFEHDIFIYDPYIDNEAIYRLKGHKSSVNSIALIPENNELLSIDILGTIKIWDTINLIDFQTININESNLLAANHIRSREELNKKSRIKKISSNIHIQTFPDLNKFLVYGDKYLLYEKGNYLNPLLSDDYMIVGCFYNPKTNNIITISNKNVKFWSIFNGKLIKMFSNLMDNDNLNVNTIKVNEYEITCFEYDHNYKKIYLGDSLGRIKCFYLSTGDFIKQFEPHKYEITHIIYSNKYDYLITCSTDLKIKFHKDKEQKDNNYKVIRDMDLLPEKKKNNFETNKILLKKIVLDEEKALLITCLSNGLINELDIEHFKTINEIETILDFIQIENIKNIPQITSAEYIKDANTFFIALDNKIKALIALKNNKNFNLLREQYIGNFDDDNIDIIQNNEGNNYKKYAIIYTFYDNKTKKLFYGDSFGYLTCYDLSNLFDNLINNDLVTNNNINEILENNLDFPIIFKIQYKKEPITNIFKPEKLLPNILIVTSMDRTVKIINYETGEFIDSLRQISILDKSFPIAVRYNIDNPFERKKNYVLKTEGNKEYKKNEEKEENNKNEIENYVNEKNNEHLLTIPNNIEDEEQMNNKFYPNIIYRKDVKFDYEPPKINKLEDRRQELIRYSNEILIYSVKEKLKLPKYYQEIPYDKSTLWNYEIDIDNLKKINEENISILNRKVSNKEKEINITENNFQHYSINTKNYFPKYIKDLDDQNEKDKIKESISSKINDVNLALNKKNKIKDEMKNMSKLDKKIHINLSISNDANNLFMNLNRNDVNSNFFLTPLKPLKAKSISKKKKEEDKLPLIESTSQNNASIDSNKEKNNKNENIPKNEININKSQKKLLNNIKIVHSPNKYQFIGKIFKNKSGSKDDKFNEYKNQFDEKINELMGPIEFIKLRKKKI